MMIKEKKKKGMIGECVLSEEYSPKGYPFHPTLGSHRVGIKRVRAQRRGA